MLSAECWEEFSKFNILGKSTASGDDFLYEEERLPLEEMPSDSEGNEEPSLTLLRRDCTAHEEERKEELINTF